MDIVSAGVVGSPDVEVWQSGHGALEVVLLHTVVGVQATGDYNSVCHLYCTCQPVNVIMYNDPLTIMYLQDPR